MAAKELTTASHALDSLPPTLVRRICLETNMAGLETNMASLESNMAGLETNRRMNTQC